MLFTLFLAAPIQEYGTNNGRPPSRTSHARAAARYCRTAVKSGRAAAAAAMASGPDTSALAHAAAVAAAVPNGAGLVPVPGSKSTHRE
jgi:hypothetical protein